MPNALSRETSPYLLQHAQNPVDWLPWSEEAFQQARAEDKPVFLSIGYSTCHWCHVMEHESFENEQVAAVMNHHFINIKVDREERPDIDAAYMAYVQATTGQGGWPMSVWLTPDGKPVFGGTYFPPDEQEAGVTGSPTVTRASGSSSPGNAKPRLGPAAEDCLAGAQRFRNGDHPIAVFVWAKGQGETSLLSPFIMRRGISAQFLHFRFFQM
jgi:hypothetical protein